MNATAAQWVFGLVIAWVAHKLFDTLGTTCAAASPLPVARVTNFVDSGTQTDSVFVPTPVAPIFISKYGLKFHTHLNCAGLRNSDTTSVGKYQLCGYCKQLG